MHMIQLLLMLELNFCHYCLTSYAYYLVSEDVYKKFILESRKGNSHCCPCQIAKMILKQVRTLIGIYHDGFLESLGNSPIILVNAKVSALPLREPSL